MSNTISITEAAEIVCSPDFRQQVEIERARLARHQREAQAAWGKSSHVDPLRPRTVEQLIEAAEQARARREAFAESPRGRFMAAVIELANLGEVEAEAALSLYSRHLADPRQPVDHDALLRAIRIMAGVNHSLARTAVLALTEIGCPLAAKVA